MTSKRSKQRFLRGLVPISLAMFTLFACGGEGGDQAKGGGEGLLSPDSEAYEQTARHFYLGLAQLQVGQIDPAIQEFKQATELAPGEPAVWADLGLARLRLGKFEAASAAIQRAASLAPESSAITFLQGRLAATSGRPKDAAAHLRRAIQLDKQNLKARGALLEAIESSGAPEADARAKELLEELLALQPENVAVLLQRARLATKRQDLETLRDSVRRLEPFAASWPPQVVEQFRAVQEATAAADFDAAARALAFLRNVLVQVPAFLEARNRVTPSTTLIAKPLTRFLTLPVPVSTPSPPDEALAFTATPLGSAESGAETGSWESLLAFSPDGKAPPVVFASDGSHVGRVDAEAASLDFPGGGAQEIPVTGGLLALDWNYDFRMDLVATGPGGVRLYLQGEDGGFSEATAAAAAESGPLDLSATGAWAADVEMDGDLDIVVGVQGAQPTVLRNNGDGTWRPIQPFPGAVSLADFAWGDLDGDGDPDAALLDGQGRLHLFANLQAGRFEPLPAPADSDSVTALALADGNADGALDLLTLAGDTVWRATLEPAGWNREAWVSGVQLEAAAEPGAARLLLADLDNNGGLDVVVSSAAGSSVWLTDQEYSPRPLGERIAAAVWSIIDLNGDGRLELVGLADGRPVYLSSTGSRDYHYQVVRPHAQMRAGDQRINSFGVGGVMAARSGLLFQSRLITGPLVHFGLGEHTGVDVIRIVWPNGVPQAEFSPPIDQAVVAQQRLKGSCPWVFADDGTGMHFVTDFLWRSPLGLRINARDTAGVTQTEDWVKIRGDQLAPRDGAYRVSITAELWETHYFDHVALVVVDHPSEVEIFVDERFVPAAPPTLAVHAMQPPQPIARAWDQDGREVTELVTKRDGRYLDTFDRGRYQGIAEEHFVEIQLSDLLPGTEPLWLVAHGWIYPTDSSINVAIAQGGGLRPQGLSLEAQDADGDWVVVAENLGFPAGKTKTILLELGMVEEAGLSGVTRLRLRTNLEIYWDALATAVALPEAPLETQRLAPQQATLRFRGYSVTRTAGRESPEIPVYAEIANIRPRWRDLVGFYTRFGDVRKLLLEVEDRYVIMNAGDELLLSFPVPPGPAPGWSRDFVFIGDGWEKDGDFNTAYSKTVLPLPAHGQTEYRAATHPPTLESDPVYQRYPEDWLNFHTRYVTPRRFLQGLRLAQAPEPHE